MKGPEAVVAGVEGGVVGVTTVARDVTMTDPAGLVVVKITWEVVGGGGGGLTGTMVELVTTVGVPSGPVVVKVVADIDDVVGV